MDILEVILKEQKTCAECGANIEKNVKYKIDGRYHCEKCFLEAGKEKIKNAKHDFYLL